MTCSICYEEIHEKKKLYCGHVFCAACISKWKSESASCPYCRQPLSRRYFREKAKSKQNYMERVRHLNDLIEKIETGGPHLIEDHEQLQLKRYKLYKELDEIECQIR